MMCASRDCTASIFAVPRCSRHQDREAGQQLGAHRLAHQRMIVHPVEHALRIELGVIRIADVEDVFPRDQHVVEQHGRVEFVALGGERMLDRIGPATTLSRQTMVTPFGFAGQTP